MVFWEPYRMSEIKPGSAVDKTCALPSTILPLSLLLTSFTTAPRSLHSDNTAIVSDSAVWINWARATCFLPMVAYFVDKSVTFK